MKAIVVAAVLSACAGCYAPTPQPGAPCGREATCPSGLVCAPATSTCELAGTPIDGPTRSDTVLLFDAPLADAASDAPIPIDAAPMATLIQQITASNNAGPTISGTLPQVPKAGDVLVMVGGNPSGPLNSVTGGAPFWKFVTSSTINVNIEIWVAVADGSGSTITIASAAADGPNTLWVGEFSGLATPVTVDRTGETSGLMSPAIVPGIVTSRLDLMIFGVADGLANTFGTPTDGIWRFTVPITQGNVTQSVWYRLAAPGATVTPTVSETSHHWDAALVGLVLAP